MRLIPILAMLALAIGPAHLAAEDHSGHDHTKGEAQGHEDKPPHGGVLKEVGDDHLELVHDAVAGSLVLYVLDGKLKAHAIPAKPLTVQVKAAGATALVPVTLTPAAREQASEFAGTAEALKGATSVEVIIRIDLDGKNQRVVFSTAKAPEAGHKEGDGHKH